MPPEHLSFGNARRETGQPAGDHDISPAHENVVNQPEIDEHEKGVAHVGGERLGVLVEAGQT